MCAVTEQHDAPVRLRTGHRRGRWTTRLAVVALAFVTAALASLDGLYAGCHYGDGRSFSRSLDEQSPRGHARDFTFLGQWIYEGGDIKYVPWQSAPPPCQGPNCHADDDSPVTTTSSPNSTVKRISPVTLALAWQLANRFDANIGCIASSNLFPISGYPHEHEYPP